MAQLLVAITGLVAVGCSVYLAGKHRRQAAVLARTSQPHGGRFTLL